ncbi:uncharacterized protein F5147DRAFT_745656 [Suillus discolor]|uniref:Uncharacterized protein n=1 Tax=Suillus discolor TaxID=1912936 RepID=A0A9P7F937_9AGAM|nr:uncharacterized protein F5147DRAFT_745656 [Suillus discolor]KAG2109026.1 hypothetical protein F5147DRAFT_745656 [Suillus discolor]
MALSGKKASPSVLSSFLSNHIDPSAPPFVFGEVFDVPRLSQAIGIHLLQWHEVKDPDSQVLDDLSCWTVWETVQQHIEIPEPRRNVSWTRTAAWVELTSLSMRHHNHASFWSLVLIGTLHQVSLPPDYHVLCFDFCHYISAHHTWEWEIDYSPAWRFGGQHIQQCEEFPVDQCFGLLSVIALRVSEVQEELRTRKGIDATHVIMTSDERDPEW